MSAIPPAAGAGRPVPAPDADSAPFWRACARGELIAQRCSCCGRWRHPPAEFCSRCHAPEYQWLPLAHTGILRRPVVVHRAPHPAFGVPYVIARMVVDGTGGEVVLTTNLIDCPREDVRSGMAVELVFTRLSGESTVPQCRPAASAARDDVVE